MPRYAIYLVDELLFRTVKCEQIIRLVLPHCYHALSLGQPSTHLATCPAEYYTGIPSTESGPCNAMQNLVFTLNSVEDTPLDGMLALFGNVSTYYMLLASWSPLICSIL